MGHKSHQAFPSSMAACSDSSCEKENTFMTSCCKVQTMLGFPCIVAQGCWHIFRQTQISSKLLRLRATVDCLALRALQSCAQCLHGCTQQLHQLLTQPPQVKHSITHLPSHNPQVVCQIWELPSEKLQDVNFPPSGQPFSALKNRPNCRKIIQSGHFV